MSNNFRKVLNESCSLLDTYKGRDKIIRTLCYLSRLFGELQSNPEIQQKCNTFSTQMSATRTTLRLLDDLLVLRSTLDYKFGQNEADKYMAVMVVMSNITDHIYLSLEKFSWLAKHKLLTGIDNTKWDTASSACWVFTSYVSILKNVRFLFMMESHKSCLGQVKNISDEKLRLLKWFHIWTVCRSLLDFTHAVNTLPPGFLWSSKLSSRFISLIGSSSSLIGLYLIIYKKCLT
ncbi:peroxisomal membrane protein 11C isoform X1 [Dendroctonus ponderosae]|uniref:Peroxisomal membrane protein 11C n=1 Tax=Dendroctonus ponderosae TaxID=77166 RepID=J3JVL0_DENPD|nr:peroxisomal membrane protein 11C isoform X1 [Dendroctonus ponderosae]AEE62240.1 unknown [Dendroctonus ponderosae]